MSRADVVAQTVHIMGSVVDDLEHFAASSEGVDLLRAEHDEIDRLCVRMKHLLMRIEFQRAA